MQGSLVGPIRSARYLLQQKIENLDKKVATLAEIAPKTAMCVACLKVLAQRPNKTFKTMTKSCNPGGNRTKIAPKTATCVACLIATSHTCQEY